MSENSSKGMINHVGWRNFAAEVRNQKYQVNLVKASLFYAQAEYQDLNVDVYLDKLSAIAQKISVKLPTDRYPLKLIKTINEHLFTELDFQGDRQDYYNFENSFLNRVIDRQKGIPITLSVIYLEIARLVGFPMVGIGMPGHFLIRPDFADAGIFVDVFNQGEILFPQDCVEKLSQIYQQPMKLEPHWLNPVSNQQILARMLSNLKQIYLYQRKPEKVLPIVEGILILFPQNPYELRDRGLLLYEMARWYEAAKDLNTYLKTIPDAEDAHMVEMLLSKIEF